MKILLNRMIDGVTDLVIYSDLNRVMEKLKDSELDITYVIAQDQDKKEELKVIADEFPQRFTVEVNPLNFELIEYLNQNNIKWRSQYFIMDLRTLKIIKNMGADSFKIKGPLLFQLDDVFATIGHEGGTVFVDPIPFISPIEAAFGDIITTAWINPKHMPLVCKKYPRIGVAFETSWKNQADRKAYTSIYNTAVWNAPLDSLLKVETSNFKDEYKFPVSFLPEEFTERRLNCRQKCTSNGCYFCKAMFNKVILFYLYAKTKLKEKEQSQD